jgi:UDP-N-acetylglucosamine--N-acetylmuramyl-(pentapeptide) pyrophosphoryl-undecaprenol N-acetylglucosamine transferase
MSKSLKIIISGGGTGGHIYPAVAIANQIKAQEPDAEILFVGAEGKMEMEKVPKAGYKIIGLPIAGINRSNLLSNIGFPFKLVNSLFKAYKLIKNFKPDIAIGVGGYASGPTLMVSNFLGIKTLIQEQNSYAGLTNKNLAKKAQKICVAYPDMDVFFPAEKIVFTGNPVRGDIREIGVSKEEARQFFNLDPDRKTLLIIGGSQGALSVNKAISSGLNDLISEDIQIIWQTGKTFIENARSKVYSLQTSRVYVADFIYEMDKAYAAADLVISRAGALSVSELCLVGKPSILVPFPAAAEDHQTKNAESLSKSGAAMLIKDNELQEKLIPAAIELSNDGALMKKFSENILKFAKPFAAREIVNEVLKIVHRK